MIFAKPLAELISEFEQLPGIGPKSAQRLAFYVLKMPYDDVRKFSEVLLNAKSQLKYCKLCQNISDSDFCGICEDPRRHPSMICVVADPRDVIAVERTQAYKGFYHVLHGLLDPMSGMGPDRLKIKELLSRINDPVEEIVLATNPTIEGDATALYLANLIKPLGKKTTRIAYGMPVGGELDYTDSASILNSIEYRREI
jgi:recombination protein RecR